MPETAIHFDSTDPILCSIADEVRCSFDYNNSHRHSNSSSSSSSSSNNNDGHGSGESGTKQDDASMTQEYAVRLESFLTRPRTCLKLFPPRVWKKLYQRITIQERLVLMSIGRSSSTTTNTTTVNDSVTVTETATKTTATTFIENTDDKSDTRDVLIAGLEVLEYTLFPISHDDSHNDNGSNGEDASAEHIKNNSTHSKHQRPERIVYIAKVDTSGCWPVQGLDVRSMKCSPAQALVRGYLKAIRGRSWSLIQHPDHHHGQDQEAYKTSLFIFARAQPQYLFAESAKNSGKRALNDRGLVRWWKNVVASVYGVSSSGCSSYIQQGLIQDPEKPKTKAQGWWLIPGIETERQALNVIQSSTTSSIVSSTFVWNYGYPDKGSKEMAHTLIPQFPDDPKSRMMQSPSCQGGFVDIHTFWELAAIGEESGAGKITGFFRIVEEDIQKVENQQQQQQHERNALPSSTRTLLSEPSAVSTSTSASASASGSTGDYTKMINFLLELDFSTLDRAYNSTKQWQDRVAVWVKKAADKEALAVTAASITDLDISQGQASETSPSKTSSSGSSSGSGTGSNSDSSSKPLWIQQTIVPVRLLCRHSQDPQEEKNQEQKQEQQAQGTTPVLNILGAGLIKRKAPESTLAPAAAVNVLNASLIKRKVAPDTTPVTTSTSGPTVNVLNASLIRRKPTATTAPAAIEPITTTTATTAVAAPSSTPAVNILGASFIKKRKVNP